MTMWLKQSTAATVKLGPFVDDADGKTAETALTISQADIRLSKNGGAFAQTNNAAGATHDENGYYGVPLNSTDTGTLGTLRVAVSEAGALPVWQDFMVVPANVWDSLFGADALQVHAVEISNGLITAAAIATDALDADALADDAVTEIQAGLATAASITALNNISAVDVRTEMDANSTKLDVAVSTRLAAAGYTAPDNASIAAILDDTDATLPGLITALNNISAADILTTALTESYAAQGAAPTLTQAVLEILQWLTEKSVAGTTATVKRRNQSTTAATYTLDDATTPTAITRA